MVNSVDFKSVDVYFVRANMPLLKAIAEINDNGEIKHLSVSVPVEFRAGRKENEKVVMDLRWASNRKFLVAVGLSKTESRSRNNETTNANLFAKAKSLAESEKTK